MLTETPQADIDRWSIDSDTPVGKLRHPGPTVRLFETPPYWAGLWVRSATTSPPGPPAPREGRSTELAVRGADVRDALRILAVAARPHQNRSKLLGPHPPAPERLYVALICRYDGHVLAIGRDEYFLGRPYG